MALSDVRLRAGPGIGLKISIETPFTERKVDERLAEIEVAERSLMSALGALNDLKSEAEQSKRDLQRLSKAIEKAEAKKSDLNTDIETLVDLSSLDTNSMRRVLGMPTRAQVWADRAISFLIGAAASLTASFLWGYFSS